MIVTNHTFSVDFPVPEEVMLVWSSNGELRTKGFSTIFSAESYSGEYEEVCDWGDLSPQLRDSINGV